MKVLIVGGRSSLGNALKPVFSEFSEVLTAGRRDCDIFIDLQNPLEEMLLPHDMDVVIHAAAHFGGKTGKDILDAENINVLGTLKLCEAAHKARTKQFIFVSTMFAALNEGADNYSIYALSKKHAEEAAQFYCSSCSLPLTVLRPSQVYGNEETFRKHQPFFYTIVDKAQRGEDITLYGSNDPRRNYIHIDDLTSVIAEVAKMKISGSYACAYPHDVTYSQIAKAASAAFNNNVKVSFLKDMPDIPDHVFEKNDSLYEKLGFYPRISLDEGMKRMANYRNSNK